MASELDLRSRHGRKRDTYRQPRRHPRWSRRSGQTEIRGIIEDHITNQPRKLRKEDRGQANSAPTASTAWPPDSQDGRNASRPHDLSSIGTCVHERFGQPSQQLKGRIHRPGRRWGRPMGRETLRSRRAPVHVGEIHGLHGHQRIHGNINLYDAENNTTIDWKITGTTTIRNVKANGPSPPIPHTGKPLRHRIRKTTANPAKGTLSTSCPGTPHRTGRRVEMRDAWIHALPTAFRRTASNAAAGRTTSSDDSELNEDQYRHRRTNRGRPSACWNPPTGKQKGKKQCSERIITAADSPSKAEPATGHSRHSNAGHRSDEP